MDGQTSILEHQGMTLALIKQLLTSLQIPYDNAALEQAFLNVDQASANLRPAEWLRQVLLQAGT